MSSTTGVPVPVVMSALWDTAVPVPRMRGLSEDDRVNGAPFFVMSHVGGVALHTAGDAERLLPSCSARRRGRRDPGRALDGLAYWMALDAWRSSAIAEGGCRRYVDGKMGDAPPDVECYTRSVEVGVHHGLVAAGLE
jgi:hypothetical protein